MGATDTPDRCPADGFLSNRSPQGGSSGAFGDPLTHLERLESESIQIMREVVAEADNPVMLYSIGKDSAVMLHLAMKAFSSVATAVSVAARRHDVEVPGEGSNFATRPRRAWEST